MKSKRCYVVTGMHRSGTSAISGSLRSLGMNFGDNLQERMANVNEKGFFEDNDIVAFNDKLLSVLGRSWSSLSVITSQEFESPFVKALIPEASNIFSKKLSLIDNFACKDPRFSILLPFWREIFTANSLDTTLIVAVRNPISVVNSLAKRDSFEREKAYYLWMYYTYSSVLGCKDHTTILVDYDSFLESPQENLNRLRKLLRVGSIASIKNFLADSDFIDSNLRHSTLSVQDAGRDPSCPSEAVEFYRALLDLANQNIVLKASMLEAPLELVASHQLITSKFRQLAAKQDGEIVYLRELSEDSLNLTVRVKELESAYKVSEQERQELAKVGDVQHLRIGDLSGVTEFQHIRIVDVENSLKVKQSEATELAQTASFQHGKIDVLSATLDFQHERFKTLDEVNKKQHLELLESVSVRGVQHGKIQEMERIADVQHERIQEMERIADVQHERIQEMERIADVQHERIQEMERIADIQHEKTLDFQTIVESQQSNIQYLETGLQEEKDRLEKANGQLSSKMRINEELRLLVENLEKELSHLSGLHAIERDEHLATRVELVEQKQAFEQEEIMVFELVQKNEAVERQIASLLASKSWMFTKPLRSLSLRVMKVKALFIEVRRFSSEFGFSRLLISVGRSIFRGGVPDVKNRLRNYIKARDSDEVPVIAACSVADELISPTKLSPPGFLGKSEMMVVPAVNDDIVHAGRILVHVHAYYSELVGDIRKYLINLPFEFDLLVSTNEESKKTRIERELYGLDCVNAFSVVVVANRGRDIGPMFFAVDACEAEFVLHIHTKKSPHNHQLRGWRRYLYEALLGEVGTLKGIIHAFDQNPNLGVLYPHPYYPVLPYMRLGDNRDQILIALDRYGFDQSEIEKLHFTDFPAGFMFWMRGEVASAILSANFTVDDFALEDAQDDGTLAHAIERLVPYISNAAGYTTATYLPESAYFEGMGGVFDLGYAKNISITNNIVVMFDHFMGGGAKAYSDLERTKYLAYGYDVIRIYFQPEQCCWVLEWVSDDDGLIFGSKSYDQVFAYIATLSVREIVINSFNSYPNLNLFIDELCELVASSEVKLSFRLHDFHSVCPSQHLLDDKERYCFVPKNKSICSECLKNNAAVRPEDSREKDIDLWRQPFRKLFGNTSELVVFDTSSKDILQRAFDLSSIEQIRTIPHKDHFEAQSPANLSGPMKIAVLGTLTSVKGGGIVNELADWIRDQNLSATITLIGDSVVPVATTVEVYGAYELSELEEVVQRKKINVVFMPTIVPETFSYTLTEAMKLELPIVAFDIGAQATRLGKYDRGATVSLGTSAEGIYRSLEQCLKLARGVH
ncbi:MAG: hypothetical protein ACJAVI_004937 [Candidatus Azotimanducaceae bacterium]|jgi:hypothetical protein